MVETCSLVLRMFIDIVNCLDQPRRDRRCLNLIVVAWLIGDEKAFPAVAEGLGVRQVNLDSANHTVVGVGAKVGANKWSEGFKRDLL